MFSYLRFFFGASIFIILSGAVLFGWYYRVTADDIIRNSAEQNNIALAKSFRNSVWEADSGVKQTDGSNNNLTYAQMLQFYFINNASMKGKPEDYPAFTDFSARTRDLLKDIEVVQFNIYTPDGKLLLSTNQIKSLNNNDPKYKISGYDKDKLSPAKILASNSDNPQSEIIHNADYRKPSDNPAKGVLVRTLIPLKNATAPDNVISLNPDSQSQDNLKPEAVLEIFFDVTKSSNTLSNFQYFSTGFIIIIFTLLYLTLVFSSRRAEKIIERQHETNVELANAKGRAESENQQKSQFLANISHELRTPLNAIIGFSEIIKDEVMGPLENEQYKNYINDIHSSGVLLSSLINDILDYSKAEAGKLELEYEDIDLNKLISLALRLQEPRAKTAEVELVKELPDEHLLIRSDAKRMRQILLNILSNAVKFTPSGGQVKISAWRNLQDSENISIEVRDTGIGIAPKDIAKALAPFGQVDSALSRKYEGTGLGLPLTKKFTELLGGQLKLTSEVDKGTVVTVVLPVNNDPKSLTPKHVGQL